MISSGVADFEPLARGLQLVEQLRRRLEPLETGARHGQRVGFARSAVWRSRASRVSVESYLRIGRWTVHGSTNRTAYCGGPLNRGH